MRVIIIVSGLVSGRTRGELLRRLTSDLFKRILDRCMARSNLSKYKCPPFLISLHELGHI